MENNAQLLKGVLEYCVLRLIEKEPTYGYEIVMQLKQVGLQRLAKARCIRCFYAWSSRRR